MHRNGFEHECGIKPFRSDVCSWVLIMVVHHVVGVRGPSDSDRDGDGMEWILTEVSRLRSGRLSQKKKNYPTTS